jgi:2-keto-4-pentenoate hydratase/2-oxohepta-3-ene-1,7-dioic acid hydratase in catechol pathway
MRRFSVGTDFTARDLQAIKKAKGLPWEKPKHLTVLL